MEFIPNCIVYRAAEQQDCTNGGITARLARVNVITDVPYKFTEWNGKRYYDRPDEVAVRQFCHKKKIDERTVLLLCDKTNNPIYTPYLKPLDAVWKDINVGKETIRRIGPMAGGNYVLIDQKHETLIRVHDRYETQQEYDTLSK